MPDIPVYDTTLVLFRIGAPHSTWVKFLATSACLMVQFELMQDADRSFKGIFVQMQARSLGWHVDSATAMARQSSFATVSTTCLKF